MKTLPLAACAFAMMVCAASAQQPPYPTSADPRGDARTVERPVPQPDGAAPIIPQQADPSTTGGSQEVLHAPAQQTAPSSSGAEKTPAPAGGASNDGPSPSAPKGP